MELTCKLHSTESLGTLDGPGIRFVIFFQGCPLHCKYCHNRDTWDVNSKNIVDIDELLNRISRSKPFIQASKGGVTASGGEPLLQAKFVTELFKRLKDMGIHTCLDTAGSLPITKEIEELLKVTDLVLLDIKHIDNQKCIDLVGSPNTNCLNFAKYLSGHNIPMWIRQVLVPGYSDDEKDLLKLKEFIASLKTVEKVEFLPYHDLGKFKWENLGISYPLEGVRTANQDDVDRAKKIIGI